MSASLEKTLSPYLSHSSASEKIGGDDGTSFPDRALVEQRKKIFSRNVVVKGLAAQIVYDKQRRVRQLRQTRSLRGGEVCSFRKSLQARNAVSAQRTKTALCEAVADTARKEKVFPVATAPKIIMFKICVEG